MLSLRVPIAWSLVVVIMGFGSTHGGFALNETTLNFCAASFAFQIDSLYTSPGNSSRNATTRQALVAAAASNFSTGCLGLQVEAARAVRIMVPNTALGDVLQLHAEQFTAETGIQISLNRVVFYEIGNEINQELTAGIRDFSDGWVLDPSVTGAVASLNGFKTLDKYIPEDTTLQWNDISRFFRTASAIYDGKVVAIPLDGDLMLMYYRRDLFDRYKLSVPVTWEDYVQLAERMNGTDVDGDGKADLYGTCFDIHPDICKANFILIAMVAPYIQYRGTSQGVFYDPDSMEPLINNAAMLRVLDLYTRLFAVQPQTPTCAASNLAFRNRTCLMTINWGDEFRYNAVNTSTSGVRGLGADLGVAWLPGSAEVLDRTTGHLVPCANLIMCPYASQVRLNNGSLALVNFAPYSAFGGWAGAVSSLALPEYQHRAYQFFSYVASVNNSWMDVLDVDSGVDPYRRSQLSTDAVNLNRWTAAGFHIVPTEKYLTAVNDALEFENMVMDTRLQRGGLSSRIIFEDGLRNLTWNRAMNPDLNVSEVLRRWQVQLAAGLLVLPFEELQRQYCKLIGCKILEAPHPLDNDGLSGSNRWIPLYIAVPVGVVFLALVAVQVMWWRHTHRRNLLSGGVKAPEAGPATTLLITDVESSTTLWELLPESVMGNAMEVHHAILRRALTKFAGYESATEGDSFICAFHTASEALYFALSVQQELLLTPWPPELIACQECLAAAEVWLTPSAAHSEVMGILAPKSSIPRLTDSRDGRDPTMVTSRPKRSLGLLSRLWLSKTEDVSASTAIVEDVLPALNSENAGWLTPGGGPDGHMSGGRDGCTTSMGERGDYMDRKLAVAGGSVRGGTSVEDSPWLQAAGAGMGAGNMESAGFSEGAPDSTPRVVSGKRGDGGDGDGHSVPGAGLPPRRTIPAPMWSIAAAGAGEAAVVVEPARADRTAAADVHPGLALLQQGHPLLQQPQEPQQSTQQTLSWLMGGNQLLPYTRPVSACGNENVGSTAGFTHCGLAGSANEDILRDCILASWRIPTDTMPPGAVVDIQMTSGVAGNIFSRVSDNSAAFACMAAATDPIQSFNGNTFRPSTSTSQKPAQYSVTVTTPAATRSASRRKAKSTSRTASVCVFRGLRVRIGMASGVLEASDVSYNAVEARFHYNGVAMRLARAVQGAAAGGQVLLSDSTFVQQRQEHASTSPTRFCSTRDNDGDGSSSSAVPVLWLHMGQHSLHAELPLQQVYQAVAQPLAGRLALFPPLSSKRCLAAGVLSAPVRRAAMAFLYTVGASALLAWDVAVARQALGLMEETFAEELARCCDRGDARSNPGISASVGLSGSGSGSGGSAYIVEASGGLLLCAFSSAAHAVRCCLDLMDVLPTLPWPGALLEHALCEELAVARLDSQGKLCREVLFRGLRMKAGLDFGAVHATINAATGRVSYRGRVMNRASRIASSASSGQVLCSRDLYDAASTHGPVIHDPSSPLSFSAISLGTSPLKGLLEPVELLLCRHKEQLLTPPPPLQLMPRAPPALRPTREEDAAAAAAWDVATDATAVLQEPPLPPLLGDHTAAQLRRLSLVLRTEQQEAAALALGLPADGPLHVVMPRVSMQGRGVAGAGPVCLLRRAQGSQERMGLCEDVTAELGAAGSAHE